MKKINLIAITTVIALALASNVQAKKSAYEESQVSKGGSISGSVMFKGTVPAPILEDLSKGKNVEFCGGHPDAKDNIRPRVKVAVAGEKLQDAVVFIQNIGKGKAQVFRVELSGIIKCRQVRGYADRARIDTCKNMDHGGIADGYNARNLYGVMFLCFDKLINSPLHGINDKFLKMLEVVFVLID